MEKIQTIFKRDWEGNRGVIGEYTEEWIPRMLAQSVATEKLDGTNVRLTVRSHRLVRLEKRRNPSKVEKKNGIEEPWYIDANEYSPEDKHIYLAALNTPLDNIKDGEWSAEALGPNIQGNPLNLSANVCCIFSCGMATALDDCPITYEGLKNYLLNKRSSFAEGAIEGIVWHHPDGWMFKIKAKDFK